MPQTHKYLTSLFSAALGVEAVLNNDKQTFILEIEKETAYSRAVSYELSLKETEVYKERFIKILRIYCIKNFDLQKNEHIIFCQMKKFSVTFFLLLFFGRLLVQRERKEATQFLRLRSS